jgi:glycosyltransferase involved in cell wall biosynthesis
VDGEDTSGIPQRIIPRSLVSKYRRDDLLRTFLFERFLIPRAARRDRLDAFVSLYQSATVFGGLSGISHSMVVHDIIPDRLPEYLPTARKRFFWRQTKRGVRRADTIIAVSKHTEKDLIQHWKMDSRKISVAHIDVDPIFSQPVSSDRIFRVRHHYGLKKDYFLSTGGLEARKNVENVILGYNRFVRIVGSSAPDLVIVGRTLPQLAPLITDVEALVREKNLTERVHILGTVPQNDMPPLYSGSIASVFPSRYEGFGMPVLEAMRSGTPVITTKRTSIPEIAGDAARYCDGSTEDITEAMREMFENTDLRMELRRRGAERAKLFSWQRFVDRIISSV